MGAAVRMPTQPKIIAAKPGAAYDKMLALQTWLAGENLGSPHVTYATYNVHGHTRDALSSLYEARHWASVSHEGIELRSWLDSRLRGT